MNETQLFGPTLCPSQLCLSFFLYPPFRGGPIGWLHTLGMPAAVATLDRLAERHGPRFAAPKILRDMAAKGERFYPA